MRQIRFLLFVFASSFLLLANTAIGQGDISIEIYDLDENNIPVGENVKGDLWGVSQPTGGGAYTWHHMQKDAVDVGGVATVSWTAAEIDAEVDISNNDFYWLITSWGGAAGNTQLGSASGLWGQFVQYDETLNNSTFPTYVITDDLHPATQTSTGLYYDVSLPIAYEDAWANAYITYEGCPQDLQPNISSTTKDEMITDGYSFSFNSTTEMLTITNSGSGFNETYNAREDGVGGYILELENISADNPVDPVTISYDDVNEQLVVDIDYAGLDNTSVVDGATFFCKPGISLAYAETYGTYDLYHDLSGGYLSAALDPLEAPVQNTTSGDGYFTIQAAIDDATANDVIEVAAGTYAETLNLGNKQLTINGAGTTQTIIDATGNAGYGISNFGNNTTIKDLALINTNGNGYGFKVSGVSGITLENILAEDCAKTGIDLNGVSNTTLTNIEVNSTVSGFGVMMNDCNGIDVTNVTTSGNAWGGVTVQATGASYTGGCSDIEFLGSFSASEDIPLLLEKDSDGGTYYDITNVSIPAQFTYIFYTFRSGDNYKQWMYQESLSDAKTLASSVAAETDQVDNIIYNLAETNYYVVPDLLIQDAIDAATEGNMVEVAAGTYEESLEITKDNLTLNGAGDEADEASNSIVSLTGGGKALRITSDGVTVQNIRFDKHDDGKGIELNGVVNNLTLNYVTVTQATNGFRVSSTTDVDGIDFDNCHFDGNDIAWYISKENNNTSTVTNVDVTNSTFNDNNRKGIYAEKLENAVFDNITVSNSGTDATYGYNNGIDINLKWSAYSNITIQNSTITNSGHYGSATDPLFPSAIAIKARDDGGYSSPAASLNGVIIENTTINGPENALRFGEPGKNNAGPINVTINQSALIGMNNNGNTGNGLINETQATVEATCNWWGTVVASDIDSKISGDVNYSTILLNNTLDPNDPNYNCGSPMTQPVLNVNTQVTYANISTAIDEASANDVIQVSPGTYAEQLVIEKSIELHGPNYDLSGDDESRNGEAIVTFPSGLTDYQELITVNADDVTIDGFTIDGSNYMNENGVSGIMGYGDDIIIQNNIVSNFNYISVWISSYHPDYPNPSGYGFYRNGIEIKDNYIHNADNFTATNGFVIGYGIYLQGTYGTVSGNVVEDTKDAIQIQPYNHPNTSGTTGLVTNNSFEGFRDPIWFNYSENTNAKWDITNNTLTGIAAPTGAIEDEWRGFRIQTCTAAGDLEFTNNTINVGTADATALYSLKKFSNVVSGMIDLDATFANNNWERCVAISDGTDITGDIFYTSIQDAIGAASDGDVIETSAGTYNEPILVNKAVTLQQSGTGSAIIDGTGLSSNHLVRIRDIASGSVVFDGFTIQNTPTDGNNRYPLSVSNCTTSDPNSVTIKNNTINGVSGTDDNWGLLVQNSTSEFFIKQNSFNTIEGNSILIERVLGPTEIAYNTFNIPDEGGFGIWSMSYKNSGDSQNHNVDELHWYHHNTFNAEAGSTIGIHGAIGLASAYGVYYNERSFGQYTNLLIEENIINDINPNSNWGRGIQLEVDGDNGGFPDAQIKNNSIKTKGETAVSGSECRGIRLLGDVIDAQITGNVVIGFDKAIKLQDSWSNDVYPTGMEISNNKLAGNVYGIENLGSTTANATCNWWGTTIASEIDDLIDGDATYTPYLQTADGPCGGTQPVHNVTQDVYYTTIQAAIDAAASGDVIEVANGTYEETLNIDGITNLTFIGEDESSTIIKPNSLLAWNVGGYGTTRDAGIRIANSDEISFESFTLNMEDVEGNNVFGILGWDSHLINIENFTVKNNQIDDQSGGYYEFGSYFRAPSYTYNSRAIINITNSSFIDCGRVFISAQDFVDVSVSSSEFYKTEDDFGYGIELASESEGTISDNVFYEFDVPAASDGSESGAIYINNAFTNDITNGFDKNVVVENNEIYNCQLGISTGNEWPSLGGPVPIIATLNNNNVHDCENGAQFADAASSAGSAVTINGGGNSWTNNTTNGIIIKTDGDGDITTNLDDEVITGSQTGILIVDETSTGSSSSYDINIKNSDLSNNTTGIDNDVPFQVNAIKNWWGASDGPGGNVNDPVTGKLADGQGSDVTTDVHFDPYYKQAAMTQLSNVGIVINDGQDAPEPVPGMGAIDPEGPVSGNKNLNITFKNETPPSSGRSGFGGDLSDPLKGYWDIVNEDGDFSYSITLDVSNVEGVKNPERVHLIKRADASSSWEDVGEPTAASLENYPELTWTGLGSFSEFALANGDQVDIAINETGCAEYEVVLRPTTNISSGFPNVTGIQFTIKYPDVDNDPTMSFTSVSPFDFTQDGPTLDGGYYYVTFSGYYTSTEMTITGEEQVLTFTHNNDGEGTGSFVVMDDEDSYAIDERVYFFEYGGTDATGINYANAEDVSLGKCPLTIGGSFTAANKTYDGTTDATIDTDNLALNGVVGGDAVSLLNGSYAAQFATKDAGTGIEVSLYDDNGGDADDNLDDADAGKYTLTFSGAPTTTADINQKSLTVSIDGDPTKVYDGTAKATLASDDYNVGGLVSSETVTVDKTTGTYAQANVGNSITVDVTLDNTLPTADFTAGTSTLLSNYALPVSASGDGAITAAPLTVTADDKSKVYDGTIYSPFTVTYDGFVNGEDENSADGFTDPDFTGNAVGATEVGTYTITPQNASATNYSFTYENGALEITPVNFTLKAMLQGAYDDATSAMNNPLRTANQLPDNQPFNTAPWNYSGNETLPSPVPSNAVDWVLVEFRDSNSEVYDVKGRAAGLIRKNGIIDVALGDGNVKADENYYIVVWHRNHMPVMSDAAQAAPVETAFDFTNSGNLFGASFKELGSAGSGVYGMLAGDVTADGKFQYSGPGNDRGPIIARIISEGGTLFSSTIADAGYWYEDVNLNNEVKYVNVGNDRAIIYANIDAFTDPTYFNTTYETDVPGAFVSKSAIINDGPVNIDIQRDQLILSATEEISRQIMDNIQFTLAWRAGNSHARAAVERFSSEYGLFAQGEPVIEDGIAHQMFASIKLNKLPASWSKGQTIDIMSFDASVEGDVWVADNAFTTHNNSMYYVSLDGEDNTGEIKADRINPESALNAQSIHLYPNPVTDGKLYIEVSSDNVPAQLTLSIYDTRGNLVRTKQVTGSDAHHILMNVNSLSTGVYVVRITGQTFQSQDRFIISK